ncbi:Bug family tripartite tricarboxylate transporter substrate binding protein [Humitalea sp. 24SJ18S-53]|uniref:Bug family tripartite tricarboxylate transporter substrate binding protein n=1 Tax=Humitalea sp. 24SJ18S-53 TaxID=3422307 RepID=UPI003D66E9D9
MRFTRRAGFAAALLPMAARAQTWPTRPFRFVIPYPPGGPTDILGRVVALGMPAAIGQSVVVENRAGASGVIGSQEVARAAPDGQTFLVNASIHTIIPHLNRAMPFDALADFVPVTMIARVPLMVVVNPALPIQTIADLIAWLRANPGRASFASSGNAAAPHLAGELFKQMTDTQMQHIPYRGSGPAIADLMAGNVQVMFDSIPSSAGAVRAGQLRALAVTSTTRTAAFPELPTVAEAGVPGFDISTWYGIWAPARTPMPIVERLQQATASAVAAPEAAARLASLGAEPVADTPAQFAAFCRSEYDRWGALVRTAGITGD